MTIIMHSVWGMYYSTVWHENNIGGEVNLVDWWMYERTAKLNFANVYCIYSHKVSTQDQSAKL